MKMGADTNQKQQDRNFSERWITFGTQLGPIVSPRTEIHDSDNHWKWITVVTLLDISTGH
eukprot:scaffold2359_cov102-Cylindrotheca_fusiformis.AAC.4